jgi:hypothetical protein
VSEGLPLLAVRINQARQLTQSLRGHGLKEEVADEIAVRLRECARLLRSGEAPQRVKPKGDPQPTRRRVLWRKDPRCFWCGRVTKFEEHYADDAATVEHVYHRRHPKRKGVRRFLPSVVLACKRCNNERGAPPAEARDLCPLIGRGKEERSGLRIIADGSANSRGQGETLPLFLLPARASAGVSSARPV